MTIQEQLKMIDAEITVIRQKTADVRVRRSDEDGLRMVELVKRQQKLKAFLAVLK